jgi:hypothetical protein
MQRGCSRMLKHGGVKCAVRWHGAALPRGTLFCNVFKVQLARVASFDSRRDLIPLALPYSGHGEEGEDDEHMQDSAEHQPSR